MNVFAISRLGAGLSLLTVLAGCSGMSSGAAPSAEPAPMAATQEGEPAMELPPGWTQEDMAACMAAGQKGAQHDMLAKRKGEWKGKTTMWMGPNAPAQESECTVQNDVILDGRYVHSTMKSEMPGMGPFEGRGYVGFDNVTQEYVAVWLDSMSTGIMTGTGKSPDGGRTIHWDYTYNCPIKKAPAKMRIVEKMTGEDTSMMEMHGTDPKSGVEYKMMEVEYTRD